jgi:predicted MFS family arabinose efflux permease
MIDRRNWREAFVLLAAIAAFGLALAGLGIYSRPGERGAPGPSTGALFRIPGFAMLFVVSMLMSIPLFIAFAFVQTFAVEDGISVSNAALLVSLIGLASIVGRIGLSALVRRVGAIPVLRGALIVHASAYGLWYVAGGDLYRLIGFAVLFGASYGGYVAVSPEALVSLSGLAGLGKSMGLLLLAFGLGGFIGPPLAGELAERSTGHDLPILVCLGLIGTATVLSLTIRTGEARPR